MSDAQHTSSHHPHDHEHHHDHGHLTWRQLAFTAAIGTLLLLRWRGVFTSVGSVDLAIILTLVGGFPIFYEAIQGLFEKRILAELAVGIAAIAALSIGESMAAAVVVFIMLAGHSLEDYAAGRARRSIRGLIELAPETVTVRREGREVSIPVGEVRVGEVALVRPGQRVPVDGRVSAGMSAVNQAFITGEALPVEKQPGDEVFAGTLNGEGALDIEVGRVGEDTTLATVVRLVDEAQLLKAPVQRLADRYATYFVPAVLLIAAATWFFSRSQPDAVLRAVTVLVVTCPCALVLATPTAVVCALARLAREGILIKGGAHLEALSEATCVALDKTGTLTVGKPRVVGVETWGSTTEDELLEIAAAAESKSEHVLARVLVEHAAAQGSALADATGVTAHPGRGVECEVGGRRILVGNAALMQALGVSVSPQAETALKEAASRGETVSLVAAGDEVLGAVRFADELRPQAHETIHELGHLGIGRVVMLTGDSRAAATVMAQRAGIREFEAELLPDQKSAEIRSLQSGGQKVVMVGDGVNDAPSLAAAEVGIAMGGTGIDLALEAADVVFMTDDLSRLPRAISFGRKTVGLIRQNMVVFALGVNAAAITAAALGKITPIMGAVIHEVSSLLVVLNSMRLLAEGRLAGGRLARVLGAARQAAELGLRPARCVTWTAVRRWWAAVREPVSRWAWRVALGGYVLCGSVYTIGPEQTGVVRRFGRVVAADVGPGPHVRFPYPVDQLTRLDIDRVRVAEIGYRTSGSTEGAAAAEPAAYEWNTQHRGGRFERRPEESLMFSGDEIMVEVNAVCQYSVSPHEARDYLFAAAAVEALVHKAAESALRETLRHTAFEDVITTGRHQVEAHAAEELQSTLGRYACGVRVHSFHLQDVHPPIEVVDAYRDVSSAFEEKSTLINEAEAYRNEQVPLARGRAAADMTGAEGYAAGRVSRAVGDADRFEQFADANRVNPQVNRIRLHRETVEECLADNKKLILDNSGRRHLYLLDSEGLRVNVPGIEQLGQAQTYPSYERE